MRSVPRAGHYAERHSHTERDQYGRERMAFDTSFNLSAGTIHAGLNIGGRAGKLGLCVVNSI
jgi:hypothetical protein